MVRYEITIKIFTDDEIVQTLADLTTDSPEVAASVLHSAGNKINPVVPTKLHRGTGSAPFITRNPIDSS